MMNETKATMTGREISKAATLVDVELATVQDFADPAAVRRELERRDAMMRREETAIGNRTRGQL